MADQDSENREEVSAPPVRATPDRRRRLLWAAVAGAAAAAGLAWSVRQGHGTRSEANELSRAAGGSNPSDPVSGFWDLQWLSPSDVRVPMSQFKGRPLLINFWATWCPPCVEELPLLDRFAQDQGPRGVQVLGLAVDRKDAVLSFLAKSPLGFRVAMGGIDGAELAKSLGNASGGLPYSVLIAKDGSVAQRKMGRLSKEELAIWGGVK
jgi:thiol-disulfide isomerase/thioredoxin